MAFVDSSGFTTVTSSAFARGTAIITASGLAECDSVAEAKGNLIHAGEGIAASVSGALGWLTIPVEIVSAIATTSTRIRIVFDRGMLDDGKLRNPGNYSVTPKFPTGVPITVISIEPQGISEPTYVDLVITEMTDGETYIVEVTAITGPTDPEGIPLGPTTNSVEFVGTGVDPTIDSVTAIGMNKVEVEFSEPMYDNAVIRDSTRYTFDNGLNVLSVLDVAGATVTLITDDQIPGVLYTLAITQP